MCTKVHNTTCTSFVDEWVPEDAIIPEQDSPSLFGLAGVKPVLTFVALPVMFLIWNVGYSPTVSGGLCSETACAMLSVTLCLAILSDIVDFKARCSSLESDRCQLWFLRASRTLFYFMITCNWLLEQPTFHFALPAKYGQIILILTFTWCKVMTPSNM